MRTKTTERPSFVISQKLAKYVAEVVPDIEHQQVTWLYFPKMSAGCLNSPTHSFGAVELSSGAIGITFAAYIPQEEVPNQIDLSKLYVGQPASSLIPLLGKPEASPVERAIAMAVINALSTRYMQEKGLNRLLEYTDAVMTLELKPSDIVGMVGFFPPLIEPISEQVSHLYVVELRGDLVQAHPKWDVTTNHAILKNCNKIMMTGSILLNGTIYSLLSLISHAQHIALIGPTASFLPDPLFEVGFDIVGGTMIRDPALFKNLLTKGLPWREATVKFVARKTAWRHPPS